MATTRKYINHLLQNIGITPACSEEERAAADHIAQIFSRHGFEPEIQEFSASDGKRLVSAVVGIALFVGTVLAGIGGVLGIIGLVLAIAAAVIFMMERMGRPVISNLAPSGLSQNVIAYHKASGPLASPRNRPVVVVAHYDSPRASVFSQMPYAAYRPMIVKLLPVAMIVPAVIAVVRLLPLPGAAKIVLWIVAILVSLIPLAYAVAIVLNRMVLPYTSGSVCNKSSVAAMLGVMDAVAPFAGENEFPRDMPFDRYFAEQRRMAEEAALAYGGEEDENEVEEGAVHGGAAAVPAAAREVAPEDEPAPQGTPVGVAPAVPAPAQVPAPEVPAAAPAAPGATTAMSGEEMAAALAAAGVAVAAAGASVPASESENESEVETPAVGTVPVEAFGADEVSESAPAVEPALEPEPAPAPEPSIINAAGNYRFGEDVIRSLGMVSERCVIEYTEPAPAPAPAPVVAQAAEPAAVAVVSEPPAAPAPAVPAESAPAPVAETVPAVAERVARVTFDTPFDAEAQSVPAEPQDVLPVAEASVSAFEPETTPAEDAAPVEAAADAAFAAVDEEPAGAGAQEAYGYDADEEDVFNTGYDPATASEDLEGYEGEEGPVPYRPSTGYHTEGGLGSSILPAALADKLSGVVPVIKRVAETVVAFAQRAFEAIRALIEKLTHGHEDDEEELIYDENGRPLVQMPEDDFEGEGAPEDTVAENSPAETPTDEDDEQTLFSDLGATQTAPALSNELESTVEAAAVSDGLNATQASTQEFSLEDMTDGALDATQATPMSELDGTQPALDLQDEDPTVEEEDALPEVYAEPIETEPEHAAARAEVEAARAQELQEAGEPVVDEDEPVVEGEPAPVALVEDAAGEETVHEEAIDDAPLTDDAVPAMEPIVSAHPITIDVPDPAAAQPVETVDSLMAQINPPRAQRRTPLTIPDPASPSIHEPAATSRASLFDLPDPGLAATDPFAPEDGEVPSAAAPASAPASEADAAPRPAPRMNIPDIEAPKLGATVAVPRSASATTSGFSVVDGTAQTPQAPQPPAAGEPIGVISAPKPIAPAQHKESKRGLGRLFGRKKKEEPSMSEYLGVDDDFDAKRSGRDIGSWDNFENDDWKGGATGAEGVSVTELRDAITSMGDDELLGHDIWFVATGASEYDNAGMRAFLQTHRDKLRGVFLINLECVGAGQIAMLSTEGDTRVLKGDKRIMNLVRKVSSAFHAEYGSIDMPYLTTDAYAAMSMSLRSLTIAGIDGPNIACSHNEEDLPYNVDPENIDMVADVVTEVIRRS